ncbi:type IV pilin protein [Ideonella sp. DXS22W]|uniref:Type IV pilin protein n=1 Tax=Pseudaquabacterium inlustre TaxID=2984192 RepID=A0ABU9CCN1_9BURK
MPPRTRILRPRAAGRGFTLIELVIVVAMVAILAAASYPSYHSYVGRTRRADAKQALLELAQRLERYYTERGTYAGATLGGSDGIYPNTSSGGYYTLSIASQSADGFSITATPTGTQSGDACAVFGYNQLGEQSVSAAATLSAGKCWQ